MKKKTLQLHFIFAAILCCSYSNLFAQHTFSIVAVDPATNEIGSAGATCLSFEGGALEISDIVLGVGSINTQAWWDPNNMANATTRMEAGDSPEEIITWLQNNDVNGAGWVPFRQYGIVDLNGGDPRSAAFTGTSTDDQKGHRIGPNYAIAGNILISQDVLDDMETAFLTTSGPLCDKLMAVMQAAKRPGADSRCLADGISSGSAFIRVAKPTDTDSSYGNLWLDINVWLDSGTFTGDPIDELQVQFDDFKTNLSVSDFSYNSINVHPNPSKGNVNISSLQGGKIDQIIVYDILGKTIITQSVDASKNEVTVNLESLNNGVYLFQFLEGNNKVKTVKVVLNK